MGLGFDLGLMVRSGGHFRGFKVVQEFRVESLGVG